MFVVWSYMTVLHSVQRLAIVDKGRRFRKISNLQANKKVLCVVIYSEVVCSDNRCYLLTVLVAGKKKLVPTFV